MPTTSSFSVTLTADTYGDFLNQIAALYREHHDGIQPEEPAPRASPELPVFDPTMSPPIPGPNARFRGPFANDYDCDDVRVGDRVHWEGHRTYDGTVTEVDTFFFDPTQDCYCLKVVLTRDGDGKTKTLKLSANPSGKLTLID